MQRRPNTEATPVWGGYYNEVKLRKGSAATEATPVWGGYYNMYNGNWDGALMKPPLTGVVTTTSSQACCPESY